MRLSAAVVVIETSSPAAASPPVVPGAVPETDTTPKPIPLTVL